MKLDLNGESVSTRPTLRELADVFERLRADTRAFFVLAQNDSTYLQGHCQEDGCYVLEAQCGSLDDRHRTPPLTRDAALKIATAYVAGKSIRGLARWSVLTRKGQDGPKSWPKADTDCRCGLLGNGAQVFRIRKPDAYFSHVADVGPDHENYMGARRVWRCTTCGWLFAFMTIPYKDEDDILVRGPNEQWEAWDWVGLSKIADCCRWSAREERYLL